MNRIVIWLTICAIVAFEASYVECGKDTYLIGMPRQWFLGLSQTIVVSIFDKTVISRSRSVQVTVDIEGVDNIDNIFQAKTVVGGPTYRGLIRFKLPGSFPSGTYQVTVTGRASGFTFKNSTKSVFYKTDTEGIYVITDKPVYKALDEVKIKVVGIDAGLLPINNKIITVGIIDAQKNLIQEKSDLVFTHGLVENITLRIPERPILGTYQIKVTEEESGKVVIQNFEVTEYVLPKFDFTVSTPDFLLKSDDNLQGNIEAKYTYGKPLDGDIYVKLEPQYYYYYSPSRSNNKAAVERIIKLSNGKAAFSLPISSISSSGALKLTVNVTEQFTGETQQKVVNINLYDFTYQARVQPNVFVPGKNAFTLSIVNPLQKPIPNADLTVDYSINAGILDSQSSTVSLKTGIDGKATLNIDVPASATQVTLIVKKADNQEKKTLTLFKKTASSSNPNDSEFQIKGDQIKSNTLATVSVTRSADSTSLIRKCDDISYMVISRSMILNTGNILICKNQAKQISFRVTHLHAPYSKIIFYYMNSTNSLVVETQQVDVNGIYNNEVKLSFDKQTVEAGQSVTLTVTAKPNSIASVVVIDQSVAILRTPNELTNEKILNYISAYQTASSSRPIPIDPIPVPIDPIEPIAIAKRQAQMVEGDAIGIRPIRPIRPVPYPGPGGYWTFPKSLTNLEANGLVILSDLSSFEPTFQVYKYVYPPRPMPMAMAGAARPAMANNMAMGGAAGPMALGAAAPEAVADSVPTTVEATIIPVTTTTAPSQELATVERIRTNFQETWICSTLKLNQSGVASLQSQIPDTITSWVASGFALSDIFGLGVADKTTITGFKSFFVNLNLPSSIIRGEIFVLQAIVSNYLNANLTNVVVTLSKSSNFKRVSVTSDGYQYKDVTDDIQITIPSIPSNSARSVSFPIVATKAGLIDLTVKAQSTLAADGATQKLRVKFEGIAESYNLPYTVDLGSDSWLTTSGSFSQDAIIKLPDNIIPGSQFCEVQVIGDLLGVAFNNLDSLIVRPYGCGEQNMITFVPNVFAVNYLVAVNRKGSQSLIDKAQKNILFGYQNQLRYRRNDGSFSAFGNSDASGSSWLTAFVVKSFVQASALVTIDDSVIQSAMTWLLSQQNSDGSFKEPGNVIHKDMQSGVNSVETLTAYITISLLESNMTKSDTATGIKKAIGYLESHLNKISDVYALSLFSYALNLGSSSLGQSALDKFNKLANSTVPGVKYWSKQESESLSSYYWRRCVPTDGIEMTSYGLLAYLLRNDVSGSVPLVRWLVSQSNSVGGYSSTQTTVLALQALSTFGIKTKAGQDFNLEIRTAAYDEVGVRAVDFKVNSENTLVLQSLQIGLCPTSFKFTASGSGSAFLQVIVTYNVPKLTEPPLFELKQTVKSKISNNSYVLETCARYTGKDGSTGMSIIESNIVSGFSADQTELNSLLNPSLGLKLIELNKDRSKVSFYFDALTNDVKCVSWKIKREFPVTLQQPVSVRVYDYYKPEMQTTILFNIDNNANVCDLSSDIAECRK